MEAGNVVRLKSGGPKMTVEKSSGGDWFVGRPDLVICVWFDESGTKFRSEFSEDVLEKIRT